MMSFFCQGPARERVEGGGGAKLPQRKPRSIAIQVIQHNRITAGDSPPWHPWPMPLAVPRVSVAP
jgi:hypothetical protein